MLNHFSHFQLFVTPWTGACQAPLSTGILQAKILECIPLPSSRSLTFPATEPRFLMFPALVDEFFTTEPPGKISQKLLEIVSLLHMGSTLLYLRHEKFAVLLQYLSNHVVELFRYSTPMEVKAYKAF